MKNKTLQPYFLLVILLVSFVIAFLIFRPFLIPLVLAAIFAVVLQPLYRRITRFVVWPGAAAGITLILCLVCIMAPLWLLGTLIVEEAQQLYVSLLNGSGQIYLTSAVQHGEETVHQYFPIVQFPSNLSVYVDSYSRIFLSWISTHVGDIFSSLASILLGLLLFSISLYYFLRDGVTFKKAIIELSPLDDKDDEAIFERLGLAVNSTIRGNLTTALIQGVVASIGLTIFGVPSSILWGLVAGVTSLIPGIGVLLVMLPASAFLFLVGYPLPALGLLVWGVLFGGSIDNLVRPRLMGRGLALHPLIVVLSVLGGLALFGPAGIFLGPLCISFLFAVLAIHVRDTELSE